jgi:hypothetical protein
MSRRVSIVSRLICRGGAFVYTQFSNLPALLDQWDRSQLKERYLKSTNYQQLQHRHLILKLISRWEKGNTALGFNVDVATITGTSETKAALAVYDIGQLDLVFIAPMSEERSHSLNSSATKINLKR